MEVARREGLQVGVDEVTALVESSGGDVRWVLNTLQVWSLGKVEGRKDGSG
jgi:DNA polymerase III delta prime subunit